jgi:hypothetical protein
MERFKMEIVPNFITGILLGIGVDPMGEVV